MRMACGVCTRSLDGRVRHLPQGGYDAVLLRDDVVAHSYMALRLLLSKLVQHLGHSHLYHSAHFGRSHGAVHFLRKCVPPSVHGRDIFHDFAPPRCSLLDFLLQSSLSLAQLPQLLLALRPRQHSSSLSREHSRTMPQVFFNSSQSSVGLMLTLLSLSSSASKPPEDDMIAAAAAAADATVSSIPGIRGRTPLRLLRPQPHLLTE
eukprot:jgi/Chlat1/8974/Chrsp94S08333